MEYKDVGRTFTQKKKHTHTHNKLHFVLKPTDYTVTKKIHIKQQHKHTTE